MVIQVWELKQKAIDNEAFWQGVKYMKGIQQYLLGRQTEMRFNVELHLVGKDVNTNGSFCYLPEVLSGIVYFHTYELNFYGVYFNNCETYSLSNEGFKFK